MIIDTEAGPLSPENLPVEYEPLSCDSCGSRIGWISCASFLDELPTVMCDECAALVSQGKKDAP